MIRTGTVYILAKSYKSTHTHRLTFARRIALRVLCMYMNYVGEKKGTRTCQVTLHFYALSGLRMFSIVFIVNYGIA